MIVIVINIAIVVAIVIAIAIAIAVAIAIVIVIATAVAVAIVVVIVITIAIAIVIVIANATAIAIVIAIAIAIVIANAIIIVIMVVMVVMVVTVVVIVIVIVVIVISTPRRGAARSLRARAVTATLRITATPRTPRGRPPNSACERAPSPEPGSARRYKATTSKAAPHHAATCGLPTGKAQGQVQPSSATTPEATEYSKPSSKGSSAATSQALIHPISMTKTSRQLRSLILAVERHQASPMARSGTPRKAPVKG